MVTLDEAMGEAVRLARQIHGRPGAIVLGSTTMQEQPSHVKS
jgi:hypothetical protein